MDAARSLFAEEGYAHVSMAEIAASVNVSAAALYRHFDGKRALLAAVIAEGLGHVRTQVDAAPVGGDRPSLAGALTAAVLDRRQLGLLWQREARVLTPAARSELAGQLHELAAAAGARLSACRPEADARHAETVGWLALSILASPAYHQVASPIVARCLPPALVAIGDAPTPVAAPVERRPAALAAHSRREQVLSTAIELCAERGFDAVTLDDIGAALGMAGPSIYTHFADKEAILLTALERGAHRLQSDFATVLRKGGAPTSALRGAVGTYVRFALDDPALVAVLVSEVGSLGPEPRRRVRRMQRAYVDEWVALLGGAAPDRSVGERRVLVHAALTLLNDAARSTGWRGAGASDALADVALAVLLAR